MGVYSNNRISFGDEYVAEANENYVGTAGLVSMLLENCENDKAMFDAVIKSDFLEAQCIKEGAELEVFTEEANETLWQKIKNAIMKAWEKIKGVYHAFLVKLNTVFLKDNKKFLQKYEKSVDDNINAGHLKELKFKWQPPTSNTSTKPMERSADGVISEIVGLKEDQLLNRDYSKELEELLGATIGAGQVKPSEYLKKAHEYFFNEEKEETGFTSEILTKVSEGLKTENNTKKLKKAQAETDSFFKTLLKNIDSAKSKVGSEKSVEFSYGKEGDKSTVKTSTGNEGRKAIVTKRLTAMHKSLSNLQQCSAKATQANIDYVKFNITQSRRLFSMAASHSALKHEGAIFTEAVGDMEQYEVESLFESFEFMENEA